MKYTMIESVGAGFELFCYKSDEVVFNDTFETEAEAEAVAAKFLSGELEHA